MWWGKIIGFAVGFAAAGFWGAVFGLALGYLVDRRLAGYGAVGPGGAAELARVQAAFFSTTFSVMGHVAKADGRVSEAEIALARSVMQRMQLPEQTRRAAIDLFTDGKRADFPLDAVLRTFRQQCRGRRNLLQMFLEIQFEAALADGQLTPAEQRLLIRIGQQLGFSRGDLERIATMGAAGRQAASRDAGASLADAYARLDLSPNATDEEVKRAYRRLTSQHHPDKLAAKGLPAEMMRMAEEKTHEIRAAYELICKARGI